MNSTDSPTPSPDPAPRTPDPAPRRRTAPRWLLVVGLIVFTVGVVFTVIGAVVPYLSDGESRGWFYLVALTATPIGFLMALGYGIFGALPPRRDR